MEQPISPVGGSKVQKAPGHFKYIYIIIKTNDLCDIISIHIAL